MGQQRNRGPSYLIRFIYIHGLGFRAAVTFLSLVSTGVAPSLLSHPSPSRLVRRVLSLISLGIAPSLSHHDSLPFSQGHCSGVRGGERRAVTMVARGPAVWAASWQWWRGAARCGARGGEQRSGCGGARARRPQPLAQRSKGTVRGTMTVDPVDPVVAGIDPSRSRSLLPLFLSSCPSLFPLPFCRSGGAEADLAEQR
jgi:hypothetical protein